MDRLKLTTISNYINDLMIDLKFNYHLISYNKTMTILKVIL